MRRLTAGLVLLLVALSSVPLAPRALAAAGDGAPTIQQFLKIRTPGAPVLLPDGSLLLRDWPDGVFQLYRVTPKATPDGPSYKPGEATFTRLTNFPDGLAGFSVSPTGHDVVLLHAAGGNENTQLTLMDLTAPGYPTRPVLANPKVQASVNAWMLDGSAFVYTANDASAVSYTHLTLPTSDLV